MTAVAVQRLFRSFGPEFVDPVKRLITAFIIGVALFATFGAVLAILQGGANP